MTAAHSMPRRVNPDNGCSRVGSCPRGHEYRSVARDDARSARHCGPTGVSSYGAIRNAFAGTDGVVPGRAAGAGESSPGAVDKSRGELIHSPRPLERDIAEANMVHAINLASSSRLIVVRPATYRFRRCYQLVIPGGAPRRGGRARSAIGWADGRFRRRVDLEVSELKAISSENERRGPPREHANLPDGAVGAY